jgi:hypothetical protein
MIRIGNILIYILIASCLSALSSCAPEACFEETTAFLKASFYNDTSKEREAPESLTITGLNKTDTIYNKVPGIQPALLPLDPSNDTCTFIISINDLKNDTVKFVYSSYPHLISKECGYTFYHNLDTVITTDMYIYKSSGKVTTANEENIRIFF